MVLLQIVLTLLALPAVVATGYLALLTVLSWRCRPPATVPRLLRFDVVVPAHDEEAGIQRTVRNLLALDWPADRFRVIVVADNCSDDTAERALAAGAQVLVRRDPGRRGKGYALEFAFHRVLADAFADAVVVVDADTIASPNLLAAFAGRLAAGAQAVQAEYAVLNFAASWRTRLMAIAFAMFHDVRSLGRARLGVSCGLRGNGMCFTTGALRRVPHSAFSIVEDLEYGIRLAQHGIRVEFAPEASVRGEMVTGDAASASQRQRWESGRMALIRLHARDLLEQGVHLRDWVLLDLAFDLLVPPLTWVMAYVLCGVTATGLLALGGVAHATAFVAWLLPFAFVGLYVLRGLQLSGMGVRGLLALAWTPVFVTWKLALMATRPAPQRAEWVRTTRETGTNTTLAG
jgi:cellulose synthase/poly-beta-1,6-N-acetylglucosamine synthase-like glycosyltransferase